MKLFYLIIALLTFATDNLSSTSHHHSHHSKKQHSGSPIECNQCGFAFYDHEHASHKDEMPYCQLIQKYKFSDTNRYMCIVCGLSYKKEDIIKHLDSKKEKLPRKSTFDLSSISDRYPEAINSLEEFHFLFDDHKQIISSFIKRYQYNPGIDTIALPPLTQPPLLLPIPK